MKINTKTPKTLKNQIHFSPQAEMKSRVFSLFAFDLNLLTRLSTAFYKGQLTHLPYRRMSDFLLKSLIGLQAKLNPSSFSREVV